MPPSYHPTPGTPLTSLDTPSMLVSLPDMERNIATLMSLLLPTGVSVRPHLKTTKSAILANKLLAAGCVGGCVAKVSEAEALYAAGYEGDLLITSPVVGSVKVRRLAELYKARGWRGVTVVVDGALGAGAVNKTLGEGGTEGERNRMEVLIDVDVGLQRTGVRSREEAVELARWVRERCPGLEIVGVQGYEGHLQHVRSREERRRECERAMGVLVSTAEALRAEGFDMSVVSTGGTGTAEFCAGVEGVTEVQPGSFIFMDTDYQDALRDGAAGTGEDGAVYANSLTVLCTVVSKQGERRVTIDAGLKSLTTDSGLAQCKDGRYKHVNMGDEHGSLTWEEGTPPLEVGDRVEMIPSHIDPTINLHDFYYAHRDGVVEEIWKVDSRGMVQ